MEISTEKNMMMMMMINCNDDKRVLKVSQHKELIMENQSPKTVLQFI